MKLKQPVNSEYEECKMLAQYLKLRKLKFTHIPNETRTPSMGQRVKNKLMGVSSGVPDYMIIAKNRLVFIEMKRKTGGKVSETQSEWLTALGGAGCIVSICYGFKEAFDFMENLLNNTFME